MLSQLENGGGDGNDQDQDESEEEKQKAILRIKELFANADYGMNVPRVGSDGGDVLESLFSSHFKSQIETGTGKGMVNVSSRKRAAQELFGCDIASMKPIEFEKYGFLMDKDILAQAKSGIANQYWSYGDGIQIRFRKDKVIATFTMEDSLHSGLKPSLVTDPRITSFGYHKGITYTDLIKNSVIEATHNWASSYIELQYHGNLTLDCIESIFIPEKVLPKISAKVLGLMRKTGATLYSERNGKLITL